MVDQETDEEEGKPQTCTGGGAYAAAPRARARTVEAAAAEQAVYQAKELLRVAEAERKRVAEFQLVRDMLERNPDLQALLVTMVTRKGLR